LSHKLWTLLIQKLKGGFEGCCASALSLYNASKMGLCLFQLPSSQFEYCTRIDGKWNTEKRKSISNKKEKGRFKTILHLGLVGELGQDLLTLGAGGGEVTNHVEGSYWKELAS
jgi:hypothetical protein